MEISTNLLLNEYSCYILLFLSIVGWLIQKKYEFWKQERDKTEKIYNELLKAMKGFKLGQQPEEYINHLPDVWLFASQKTLNLYYDMAQSVHTDNKHSLEQVQNLDNVPGVRYKIFYCPDGNAIKYKALDKYGKKVISGKIKSDKLKCCFSKNIDTLEGEAFKKSLLDEISKNSRVGITTEEGRLSLHKEIFISIRQEKQKPFYFHISCLLLWFFAYIGSPLLFIFFELDCLNFKCVLFCLSFMIAPIIFNFYFYIKNYSEAKKLRENLNVSTLLSCA